MCRADRSPQQKWRETWAEYEEFTVDREREKFKLPAREDLSRWVDDGGRA